MIWQIFSFIGLVGFFWISYAVMTDSSSAERDRPENSFGLFDFFD